MDESRFRASRRANRGCFFMMLGLGDTTISVVFDNFWLFCLGLALGMIGLYLLARAISDDSSHSS